VRVQVQLQGRPVRIRAWRHQLKGADGYSVPVLLLDTDLEHNTDSDRRLTDHLYGGDARMRLCQEAVLGIGGVRVLRALGYTRIRRFHMNEGHASLLTLELAHELAQQHGAPTLSADFLAMIKPLCVFTTHTPVATGHDQFPLALVNEVLTNDGPQLHEYIRACCLDGALNMTYLALANSYFVNGVAKRHREVSRHMFAQYRIDSITNGMHAATWIAPSIREMLDRNVPDWRLDNASLRSAMSMNSNEVWSAHQSAKHALLRCIAERSGVLLNPDTLTIGFARRATTYKRAHLLFWNPERLIAMQQSGQPFQVIYGGKAHPQDQGGKNLIRQIFRFRDQLQGKVNVVYLEEYDMALARLMTAGVDLWLNTPLAPMEASGTSRMKAAMNGVPSLSILDGWWVEGCIEGVTGWSFGGSNATAESDDDFAADGDSLYRKLEGVILPLFYGNREAYIAVMRQAMAINGSFFNTERMLDQYLLKAYFE
jgi:starch phosphorylase